MTAIAVTEPEAAEVRTHANAAIPPRRGAPQGYPPAAAAFDKRIPQTWSRDGTPTPVGWTARDYVRNDAGEIETSQDEAWRLLDEPGAELSVATAGVLLGGVGERGDRRFSLQFAFRQFSGPET